MITTDEQKAVIRAKFFVRQKEPMAYPIGSFSVTLDPIYDTGIEEDKRYSAATPTGQLLMGITNPGAYDKLEIGDVFYLDLIPAGKMPGYETRAEGVTSDSYDAERDAKQNA